MILQQKLTEKQPMGSCHSSFEWMRHSLILLLLTYSNIHIISKFFHLPSSVVLAVLDSLSMP